MYCTSNHDAEIAILLVDHNATPCSGVKRPKNKFSYFVRNNGVNSTTFNVYWLITDVYTG